MNFPLTVFLTTANDENLERDPESGGALPRIADESCAGRVGAGVANGVAGTYRTRRVTHRSDMSNIHARNLPPRPRVANLLASDSRPECLLK